MEWREHRQRENLDQPRRRSNSNLLFVNERLSTEIDPLNSRVVPRTFAPPSAPTSEVIGDETIVFGNHTACNRDDLPPSYEESVNMNNVPKY